MDKMSNFLSNLLTGLLANTIIFLIGLNWFKIAAIFKKYAVRLIDLFGKKALEKNRLTVVLDCYDDIRLAPPAIQADILKADCISQGRGNRFYKIFPNGHYTGFPGAYKNLLGYCSARAAVYLSGSFSSFFDKSILIESDEHAKGSWEGSYICLGSSVSNIKTDNIKNNQSNKLLANDMGSIELRNGRNFNIDSQTDKGYILKIQNPFYEGYSLIICAGLGEWGTSGAAYYLSKNWLNLSKRFGKENFIVIISVMPEADESAKEIYSLAEKELKLDKIQEKQ